MQFIFSLPYITNLLPCQQIFLNQLCFWKFVRVGDLAAMTTLCYCRRLNRPWPEKKNYVHGCHLLKLLIHPLHPSHDNPIGMFTSIPIPSGPVWSVCSSYQRRCFDWPLVILIKWGEKTIHCVWSYFNMINYATQVRDKWIMQLTSNMIWCVNALRCNQR